MGGIRAKGMTRKQKVFVSHNLKLSPDDYLWVIETEEYIILENRETAERETYNRKTGERIHAYGHTD